MRGLASLPSGLLQHLQIWGHDFITNFAWADICNTYLSHMSHFIKNPIINRMPVASEMSLTRPGTVVFELRFLLLHNILLEWNNLEGNELWTKQTLQGISYIDEYIQSSSFWLKLENVIQFLTGLLLLEYLKALYSFRRSFVPLISFRKI